MPFSSWWRRPRAETVERREHRGRGTRFSIYAPYVRRARPGHATGANRNGPKLHFKAGWRRLRTSAHRRRPPVSLGRASYVPLTTVLGDAFTCEQWPEKSLYVYSRTPRLNESSDVVRRLVGRCDRRTKSRPYVTAAIRRRSTRATLALLSATPTRCRRPTRGGGYD